MESTDKQLIERLSSSNPALARLYREHRDLEERLLRLERRGFKTQEEETQIKTLKAQKLSGVDAMMRMLSEYRASDDSLAM